MTILSTTKANEIIKKYNYTIFSHINENLVLVRYSNRLNENIRMIIKDNDNESLNYKMNEIALGKNKGYVSAVQIASAISSYARISINKFKNLTNNPCIMSDTDSVVLLHPLDDSDIGIELGQMKLEYKIAHGIFIRKK